MEERYPVQLKLWSSRPEELVIDGGDTFQEVPERIVAAFWDMVNANRGKTILVISHMICLTLLMLHFEGRKINEIWEVKPSGNAALTVLEVAEDDSVEITVWSDDSFVPAEEKRQRAGCGTQ